MKNPVLAVLVGLACGGVPRVRPPVQARVSAPSAASLQTCRRDRSGIDWALPFATALARAKSEQRLLFLKPIAFGTSADGGW